MVAGGRKTLIIRSGVTPHDADEHAVDAVDGAQ